MSSQARVLKTPDGRYLVIRGRLWRASNPKLREQDEAKLVAMLMEARRQLRGDASLEKRVAARVAVNKAKYGLGERGPVWWEEEAPDLNRHLIRNTPYAAWYAELKPREEQT